MLVAVYVPTQDGLDLGMDNCDLGDLNAMTSENNIIIDPSEP